MDKDKPGYIGDMPAERYQEIIDNITKAPKMEDIEDIKKRLIDIELDIEHLKTEISKFNRYGLNLRCATLNRIVKKIVRLSPLQNAEINADLKSLDEIESVIGVAEKL